MRVSGAAGVCRRHGQRLSSCIGGTARRGRWGGMRAATKRGGRARGRHGDQVQPGGGLPTESGAPLGLIIGLGKWTSGRTAAAASPEGARAANPGRGHAAAMVAGMSRAGRPARRRRTPDGPGRCVWASASRPRRPAWTAREWRRPSVPAPGLAGPPGTGHTTRTTRHRGGCGKGSGRQGLRRPGG